LITTIKKIKSAQTNCGGVQEEPWSKAADNYKLSAFWAEQEFLAAEHRKTTVFFVALKFLRDETQVCAMFQPQQKAQITHIYLVLCHCQLLCTTQLFATHKVIVLSHFSTTKILHQPVISKHHRIYK